MTKQEFIGLYLSDAEEADRIYHIYPVVILAQAAIESGWGESRLAKEHHNLFGITGYGRSNEYWHGCKVELSEGGLCFRKYRTTRESIFDFARLIRTAYPTAANVSRKPASYASEIAYSRYISEVNGDNRVAYRRLLFSITISLQRLIEVNNYKRINLSEALCQH